MCPVMYDDDDPSYRGEDAGVQLCLMSDLTGRLAIYRFCRTRHIHMKCRPIVNTRVVWPCLVIDSYTITLFPGFYVLCFMYAGSELQKTRFAQQLWGRFNN